MPEIDVTREAKDVILKQVTRTLGDDLFRRFGIDLPPSWGR